MQYVFLFKQRCTHLLHLNCSSLEPFLALAPSLPPQLSQPISIQHPSPAVLSPPPPSPSRTRLRLVPHPMACSPHMTPYYTSRPLPSLAWVLIDSCPRRVPLQLPIGAARIPRVPHQPRRPLPGTCSHTSSTCCHPSSRTSHPSCTMHQSFLQPSPNLSPSPSLIRLRNGLCPGRTALSSTTSGPHQLSHSSHPLLPTPFSTTSAVEGQGTSRLPPTTGMLVFLAVPWETRARRLITSPPLALNSIGQSSSLPIPPPPPPRLLPQLGKVPKAVPAVAILLPVQHHLQEPLTHPLLRPQPPLPPHLLLPPLGLILPTQSPPPAPVQPLPGNNHPLSQLLLPQPLSSSSPLPPPPQHPSLSPNPASQAMVLLCPQ